MPPRPRLKLRPCRRSSTEVVPLKLMPEELPVCSSLRLFLSINLCYYIIMFDRVTRNSLVGWAAIAGVIIAIVIIGMRGRSQTIPQPSQSPAVTASQESLTKLAPEALHITSCVPKASVCPDGSTCPASGVCCPAGAIGCPEISPQPSPLFCEKAGLKICPGKKECLPSLTCPIEKKSEIVCVPGSTCADTSICPTSGLCPGPGRWCLPGHGLCPGKKECPLSGVCEI